MSSIRVRFAPSPTGPLHIGGLRTALYNYLFARKRGGRFIVRIEDTDQSRFVPGAEAYIFEALKWCQIEPDESPLAGGAFGPYRQSERRQRYADCVHELVMRGHAYYAFDTQEALEALRAEAAAAGSTFVYNSKNRETLCNSLCLEAEAVAAYRAERPYVIRFKTPASRTLVTEDRIRGRSEIDSGTLDDKILYKSDGMPTYHLANVVDDHAMEISHVIRGEEWLPSLALHQLLYEAFGWAPPEFAHLPLLLKPSGKGKLSKRDGDRHGFPVFPLAWCDPQSGDAVQGYREGGYRPEVLVNTLALLGWNPGTDQECFSLAELERTFSLDRVNKSGARFNPDKAVWFNHQYLQKRPVGELAVELDALLREKQIEKPLSFLEHVVALNRGRVNFVKDFLEAESYFFERPRAYEKKAARRLLKSEAALVLRGLETPFRAANAFDREVLSEATKRWIQVQGFPLGKTLQLLRLSLAGALQGPDVFAIAVLLGKEESLARLRAAQLFAAGA